MALYIQQPSGDAHQLQFMEGIFVPNVPIGAVDGLERIPSEQKFLNCLREMGPDKAPGLDGFTVRFVLKA
jgi:hypothetical protein